MNPNNLMKSVELEKNFRTVSDEVFDILFKIQAYVSVLEVIYKDTEKNKDQDFIADMQMKQATLLKLVNKLNDIAMQAMAINEQEVYFKCEEVKRQVADTMTVVRNLYM